MRLIGGGEGGEEMGRVGKFWILDFGFWIRSVG